MNRLRRWWRNRRTQRLEPCEGPRCGRELRPRETHTIRGDSADDGELGIGSGGGTFMTSTFCATHCPGRCDRGCPPVV